ncbi:MAG TPA: bifunctional riboflavin kinase/FAD synthetase [Clostridiales bacterium]|nr:bifunctional riboflavin kinase/FAD synthetase [Clostridiales bacterium]
MLLYTNYEEAKNHVPYCIALGSFDGVHIGHQKLIQTVIRKSKELNCRSMVYTFKEHPKKILSPGTFVEMITQNHKRIEIMSEMGIDIVYFEDFENIMKMDEETFVKDILIAKFEAKCVVVGYNFTFGNGKKGNAETLKAYGKLFGFDVQVVDAVTINGEIVSSSLIRKKIKDGQVEDIDIYLGRHYSIDGQVVRGRGNGRKIGIRTANININDDIVIPKPGVYLTNTFINNKEYKSVTNIGTNPTFNGKGINIETHIIDFDGDIYYENIEIEFLKWIREEKTFNTPTELRLQIIEDINFRLNYK